MAVSSTIVGRVPRIGIAILVVVVMVVVVMMMVLGIVQETTNVDLDLVVHWGGQVPVVYYVAAVTQPTVL